MCNIKKKRREKKRSLVYTTNDRSTRNTTWLEHMCCRARCRCRMFSPTDFARSRSLYILCLGFPAKSHQLQFLRFLVCVLFCCLRFDFFFVIPYRFGLGGTRGAQWFQNQFWGTHAYTLQYSPPYPVHQLYKSSVSI